MSLGFFYCNFVITLAAKLWKNFVGLGKAKHVCFQAKLYNV